MISGNPKFEGGRLSQAREARGLTKRSLAEAVGISDSALSNLEKSRSKPKDETIDRIASVLGFSRSFFLRPKLVEVENAVFWRRQKSEPLRSQERTRQRIEWAAEIFLQAHEFVQFNELKLPSLALPKHWAKLLDEDIEDIAQECRELWHFGSSPIPNMTLAIENLGIPVVAFPIENAKQYGYCTWVEIIGRPIVGVNTERASLVQQRFSLAHELAHLLLHQHVSQKELRNSATHKQIEKQAHRFAAAFLFPAQSFLREIEHISLAEFSAQKERWGMSILAQIVRARDLGICSEERFISLIKQASSKGYRKPLGEPLDEQLDLEEPRMLRRAVDVIEHHSENALATLRLNLSLPANEERYLTGRTLAKSHENVVRLRPKLVVENYESVKPADEDEWHVPF